MAMAFYLAVLVILAGGSFLLSYIDSEVCPPSRRGCLTYQLFVAGLIFLAIAFVLAIIVIYRTGTLR